MMPHRDPTILLDFQLRSGWDRGVSQGVMELGRERNWNMLLTATGVSPGVSLAEMVTTWHADAVIFGGASERPRPGELGNAFVLAVGDDLASAGLPSICVDDSIAGELAAKHLLRSGLRTLTVFAYSDTPFARRRAAAFRRAVAAVGAICFDGGEFSNHAADANFAGHAAIIAWLNALPKPCGVFALCDEWARPLATYCRHLGLRVPEDVALIGVDNDPLVCELASPPLTSVAIPWREIGRRVVETVADHLAGRPVPAVCVKVPPLDVVARRSTDTHSIEDAQVAAAVAWIRQNAHRVLTVDDVVRAVHTYRQRLERQFRVGLGRTVMEEVRQAHIEIARTLLRTTDLPMPEVAARSGFTNATLLGINFRKVVGQTPREYRRRARGEPVPATITDETGSESHRCQIA